MAVLTDERLIVFRVTKTGASFSVDTVVTNIFAESDALSIIYDFSTNDILLVKKEGGFRVVFKPGLTCHPNCSTCVSSFSANSEACGATSCALGSTFDTSKQVCAKDATPQPYGGYYSTYLGLAGTLIPVEIEKPTEEADVEDDPNKIVKTNLSVIFIMFGSIFLLTMIILFGLVSGFNLGF